MAQHAIAEDIVAPKVVTDGFADTSSIETILDYVIKPEMSDQEKVLAIYNWYRRMIYPGRYMGKDRRNLLKLINSYGATLCGSHAATSSLLFKKAGFDFRVTSASCGKEFGHTFIEVAYGGRWHVMDLMSNFMVFDRSKDRAICSLEQMGKDPSLLLDAQKEGRVGPEFLSYIRNPEIDYATRLKIRDIAGNKASALSWHLMVFENKNLFDFWKGAIHKPEYQKVNDHYGGRYRPGLLNVTLRPNETYVRTSEPMGKWLTKPSYVGFPPYDMAGGRTDEHDTVNFPFFAPYKRGGWKFNKYVYRYYANGWLEWKPNLNNGELAASAMDVKGVASDPKTGFFSINGKSSGGGHFSLPFKSPYAIVGIEIDVSLKQSGTNAVCRIGRRTRSKFYTKWEKTGDANGVFKIVMPNIKRAKYRDKLEFNISGDPNAKIAVVRTKIWFQLNFMSLPGLLAGENAVTVTAASPRKLKDTRLVVTYEWEDGENWKTSRKDEQTLAKLPATYTIKVEGPNKVARLKRITMTNMPAK